MRLFFKTPKNEARKDFAQKMGLAFGANFTFFGANLAFFGDFWPKNGAKRP